MRGQQPQNARLDRRIEERPIVAAVTARKRRRSTAMCSSPLRSGTIERFS
jgi:hypothetical protein